MKSTVNIDDAILENYLQYIGCASIDLNTKNSDSCSNPTIVFQCQLSSGDILVTIDTNTGIIVFSIDPTGILNGKAPFTYLWTFDGDDIILTSGVNESSVSFKLKDGKDIDNIVLAISIEITDSNNCTYNKTCYLINKDMQCMVDYSACRTTSSLVVSNKVTTAVPPSGLVVTLI